MPEGIQCKAQCGALARPPSSSLVPFPLALNFLLLPCPPPPLFLVLSSLAQAHRLLGTALLNLKHYPDAIRSLKKAMDLGASSGLPPDSVHMVEAERDLLRAKYEEWQVDASARRERQRKLK